MSATLERLYQIVTPAVEAVGMELWGLEYQVHGRRALLRIYIDGPEGVSVDDCARVSHQVSGALDVEDPIKGEYALEVSSPGIDRPLYRLDQYEQSVGEQIAVRLHRAFEGRKRFQGVLTGVVDGEIVMIVENHEYIFPFEGIDKAHVVGQVEFNS